MKLTFEIEKNGQKIQSDNVTIFASEDDDTNKNCVGRIFTPSGTGQNIKNAIQVCGFEEAFDYWGCGVCGEVTQEKIDYTKEQLQRMRNIQDAQGKTIFADDIIRGYYLRPKTTMKRDIQLRFNNYQNCRNNYQNFNCAGCFNTPCTCDNKENVECPYMKIPKSIGNQELHNRFEEIKEITNKITLDRNEKTL